MEAVEHDALYLQVHGLTIRPEQLNKQVVYAIDQMRETLYGEPTTELAAAELQVLQSGGFTIDPVLADTDPAANAATTYAALLATSLDSTQAAERLNVKPTRIRQMLAERTLYGIRLDGRWHIPAFQFWQQGLIPQIGKVNAVLSPDLHPLAVYRWFTLPTADLETTDETPVSPLNWLRAGGAVEPVIELARHL